MRDIDEESDFDDIKKRGKRSEMSDIDEESDFEDIKKRGKRREMRDEEDIDIESFVEIVKLKTSKRGKEERDERY